MRTDKTRTAYAKTRTLSRRADRRIKSARLFLAFAFPPSGDAFGAPIGAR